MSKKPELRGRAARLARLLPGGPSQAARTPFVLLVVLLLGGGLITLLILNSSLNEGSFQLTKLKKETQELTDEEQELQKDVDEYAAPDALQRRARELGMVPGGDPAFLNPDGTVRGKPGVAPGSATVRESSARRPVPVSVPAPPPAARPPAAPVPEPTAAASPSAPTGPGTPPGPQPPATPRAPAAAPPATRQSPAPPPPPAAPARPAPTTPGR